MSFEALFLLNPILLGCFITFLMAIVLPPGFLPWLYNLTALGTCGILMSRSFCSIASDTQLFSFDGILVVDQLSSFACFFLGAIGFVVLLKAPRYLERKGQGSGEFYLLTLTSLSGMVLVSSTTHFTGLFLGLETMTIPLYFLMSVDKNKGEGRAAALKYLALGGVGSALFLYGIALIYGETGTLNFPISMFTEMNLGLLGMFFLLAGFLFKIGAFPFQGWVPDIYAASPTPLTGFMATGVKAAAFIAFLRFISPFWEGAQFLTLLPIIALLTMTVGNFMALRNQKPKEVLAYSSIAHTGYLLVGFCAGDLAVSGILLYLAAYTLMTLGAFAVLSAVPQDDDPKLLQGLIHYRPAMAIGFAVCILSLAGIPPLLGFHGKLLIFQAAWATPELQWLVMGAIFNSLIALGYYIPLVRWALFADKGSEEDQTSRSFRLNLACFVSALTVIIFGLYPQPLLNLISHIKI